MKTIVVVGGGAGGLELATRLGRKLGKKQRARILLVDRMRYHIWKPLLHEVAAGSLDTDMDGVDFRAHGMKNYFDFQLGTLTDIDRDNKNIVLAPITDQQGREVIAQRTIAYDFLIFSIGSITNDFGTKGISEFCHTLDTTEQANKFHQLLLNEFLKIQSKGGNNRLDIAIVGAGATGVELAAELFKTSELMTSYGYSNSGRSTVNVTIIEAGPRILPALPEHIGISARKKLESLGARFRINTKVAEATSAGFIAQTDTDEAITIPANIRIWAAGVKAPPFMSGIGGLETNRINQLVVQPTLQTNADPSIFALGDCASCQLTGKDGKTFVVPPRAQSAHQMASLVYKNILAALDEKPLKQFTYKDYGSLVSLADYSALGFISGQLIQRNMFVEGSLARVFYLSLYRMHQVALHGYFKTFLLMIVGRLNRTLRPLLKLH